MDRDAVSFAFDIGTNSIGWSVLGLDEDGRPVKIIAAGVRVFSNSARGRLRKPPGVERRAARSASRRRDRYLRRRRAFLRELVAIGLLPASKADYQDLIRRGQDRPGRDHLSVEDPYVLRARALFEALDPYQVGRALFHLARNRGRAGSPSGEPASGRRTRGELLAQLRVRRQAVRQRAYAGAAPGGRLQEIFGDRGEAESEFLRIWSCQCVHHRALMTDERRDKLFRILFHERSQPGSAPGHCRFNPGEERALRAHPLFQRFRMLKELNELRIAERGGEERALTMSERNRLIEVLSRRRWVNRENIRSILGLAAGCRFAGQLAGRAGLRGDETAAVMRRQEFAGARWDALGVEDQSKEFESRVNPKTGDPSSAAGTEGHDESNCNLQR